MSEKTIDFPLPPIEALKFALKNCPFFHHSTKTLGQLRSLLKEDGDFLIQEGMLLSVRVYGQVMEFPIEIDNNKGHVQFTFSGCGFDSLEDFVLTFSKGGGKSFIQTRRGDQFQLVRPILREQYAGRFGYGECLNVRVGRNKECPSFVRALRTEFVSSVEELEQDLEKLIALEHRNLVRVCDFFLLRLPPSTSPLVFIRYDQIPEAKSLFDRLFNQKDVLSARRYIKWAYQAAKGLNYLLDRGILHRRLNARACLLDKMENLRLSDFWTDNDPGDAQLFQRDLHLPHNIRQSAILYRDGWRYLPVETLINGQFDSTSQVWTFALLVWQIYTRCQFGNRIFYTTLAEFLSVTRGREPPYFMPGHLSPQEALQGMPEQRRRKMLFVRASSNLPHSPDSLAQLIPKALLSERSQRPYFSELFRMVEAEKRILDAAHVLGYFL